MLYKVLVGCNESIGKISDPKPVENRYFEFPYIVQKEKIILPC